MPLDTDSKYVWYIGKKYASWWIDVKITLGKIIDDWQLFIDHYKVIVDEEVYY